MAATRIEPKAMAYNKFIVHVGPEAWLPQGQGTFFKIRERSTGRQIYGRRDVTLGVVLFPLECSPREIMPATKHNFPGHLSTK